MNSTCQKTKYNPLSSARKPFFSKLTIMFAMLGVLITSSISSVFAAWPPDSTPLNYSDILLKVDLSQIASVGYQDPKGQACACFALAYARTITDGRVHHFSEYNVNGNNQYTASADWSAGSYYGAGYPTKREVLFFMYKDIQNGRPVIAQVTSVNGSRSTQHFVTVVGVQNVTSFDQLTEANFLILDPGGYSSQHKIENMGGVGYEIKYYNDGSPNHYFIARALNTVNTVEFASSTLADGGSSGGASSYPDSTPLNYSDMQLTVNMSHISSVGYQSASGRASGCFSLAYARTITDGRVHYFSEYNTSGTNQQNASANWSAGSYYGTGYPTKFETLFFIYKDLQNGKPVVAQVSGSRSSQHFVTIVGVENVTSFEELSEENLLILDPGGYSSEHKIENMAEAGYQLKYYNDGSVNHYFIVRALNTVNTVGFSSSTLIGQEPPHEHAYDASSVTEPTCEDHGYTTFTCSCGAYYTDLYTAPTGHFYGGVNYKTVPTETSSGEVVATCINCSSAVSVTMPALNDANYSYQIKREATCQNEGWGIATWVDHPYGDEYSSDIFRFLITIPATEHIYATWNITSVPTEERVGSLEVTCENCDAMVSVSIPKLSKSNYRYWLIHEPTCDDLGKEAYVLQGLSIAGWYFPVDPFFTRDVPARGHTYKTGWTSDKTGHWHECAVCGSSDVKKSHTPGAAATETSSQTCTTCGFIIQAALGHTHRYGNNWETNATKHWHACSGCGERKDIGDHVYHNACDTTCNTCGYTRTISHTYKTTWETNNTQHWHICSVCGASAEKSAHWFGDASDATCDICGYVREIVTTPLPTTEPEESSALDTDDVDVTELPLAKDTSETEATEPEETTIPAVTDAPASDNENGTIILVAILAAVGGAGIAVVTVLLLRRKK